MVAMAHGDTMTLLGFKYQVPPATVREIIRAWTMRGQPEHAAGASFETIAALRFDQARELVEALARQHNLSPQIIANILLDFAAATKTPLLD